eukprot:m.18704 g.18704  ORF g.18704 m.18704 type:complete len:143 (+) comp10851_c0_seq2:785-1213(+)
MRDELASCSEVACGRYGLLVPVYPCVDFHCVRQVGFVAAAGLIALDNIERLAIDHQHARMFAEAALDSPSLELVQPVDTNIVLLRVRNPANVIQDTAACVQKLADAGVVTALGYDPTLIRAVFHLDITSNMAEKACEVLRSV